MSGKYDQQTNGQGDPAGPRARRLHVFHKADVLVEGILPPGLSGPPQHVHHEHDETFIVTEGKLRFISGSDCIRACIAGCRRGTGPRWRGMPRTWPGLP
jgi:hypothetical protein